MTGVPGEGIPGVFREQESFMYLAARRRAFSMIELVIVVVIIGIIAAIAVPRMSRGAEGAKDSTLIANLTVLRNAIDLYQTEHAAYPAVASIVAQLTTYTDANGGTSASKDATHIYGPYLRAVPELPVGPQKGQTGIAASASGTVGWIYDETTGKIYANTGTLRDASNKLYTDY